MCVFYVTKAGYSVPLNNHAPGVPSSLRMNVVTVGEVKCPAGAEPICWHLVTSEPIGTPEEIAFVVDTSLPEQLDGFFWLARQDPIQPARDGERGTERQRRIDCGQTLEAPKSERVIAARPRRVVDRIVYDCVGIFIFFQKFVAEREGFEPSVRCERAGAVHRSPARIWAGSALRQLIALSTHSPKAVELWAQRACRIHVPEIRTTNRKTRIFGHPPRQSQIGG